MSFDSQLKQSPMFVEARNMSIQNTSLTINNYAVQHPENDSTNKTDISMENVANQSVHLHLQHTEIYQCSAHQEYRKSDIRKLEDVPDDQNQDEDYTNLSAAFSKTLAMADKTENARALRRAANTFSQLVRDNPFTEEDSTTEAEDGMAPTSQHRFMSGAGSPWNQAVQGVVDSVTTMSRCATGIHDHPDAVAAGVIAPSPATSQSFPSYSTPQIPPYYDHHYLINAVRSAVVETVQAQFSINEMSIPQSHTNKNSRHRPDAVLPPGQALSCESWMSQTISTSSVSPSRTLLEHEPDMSTVDASEGSPEEAPAPAPRAATATQPSQIPKERTMTIHPLLMPPEDKLIPAHRLASLYFAAILDPYHIPEFKAEYIYADGQCTSILLTFKNVYDADRLKELWDSADRENTRAPELAEVLLYRGNTFAKPTDKSVQDAAFEELGAFRLMPRAVF